MPQADRPYRDVPMPDWFVLESENEDDTWIDQAFCTPVNFWQNADGSYLCSDGGSGLRIRASPFTKTASSNTSTVAGPITATDYYVTRYPGLGSPADLPF